jgi:hypothetical protein
VVIVILAIFVVIVLNLSHSKTQKIESLQEENNALQQKMEAVETAQRSGVKVREEALPVLTDKIASPIAIISWMQKYKNDILSVPFARKQLQVIHEKMRSLYGVSQKQDFRDDIQAYLDLKRAEEHSSPGKLQEREAFLVKKWNLAIFDQIAMFNHFSANPVGWGMLIEFLKYETR